MNKTDAERLILIRALATNMVENGKNGADSDNRPLARLLKELAFNMELAPGGDVTDITLCVLASLAEQRRVLDERKGGE